MPDSGGIRAYVHADFLRHDPGAHHPEHPDRLRAVLATLESMADRRLLHFAQPTPASDEQLLLAHRETYLADLKDMAPRTGRQALDPDTVLSPGSLKAALLGVGAACQAVDAAMGENIDTIFCASRPPGHHALADRAMGFCLFNHVAIAALYAQRQHGLERVALVDFDVHHGNGAQAILQGRRGLLYLSTHQSPFYPGTGGAEENRDGNILNIPLSAGTGDQAYQEIFAKTALPALAAFRPQLLLVSAGFDAHQDDPLAHLNLTEATYRWLGQQLQAVAQQHCRGKLISILEGGYDLKALAASARAYLLGMAGE